MKKLIDKIRTFFKKLRPRGYVLLILAVILPLVTILSLTAKTSLNDYISSSALTNDYDYTSLQANYNIPLYTTMMKHYETSGTPDSGVTGTVLAADMVGSPVTEADDTYGEQIAAYEAYLGSPSDAHLLSATTPVSFIHNHNELGLYYLAIDYVELENNVENTKINILINGMSPFYESQTIVLPSRWAFTTDTFALDRYENEIQPSSEKQKTWRTHAINDNRGMHAKLFAFELAQDDVVSIAYVNSDLLIGQIHYVTQTTYQTYQQYLTLHGDAPQIDANLMYSARGMLYRSDPSIRLRTEQDPNSLYYDTQFLRLNTIYGDSWRTGGQTIAYDFEVPTTGYYHISIKYRQYQIKDLPVFRNIAIDGEIPFDLLECYAFPYTTSFLNRTLMDENGEPLNIYLTAGTHAISFEAVNYPYREAIETIQYLMNRIQSLALNVKRYTSGGTDQYRDWDIAIYFPNAVADILSWADLLDATYAKLKPMSLIANPSEISNMKVGAARLRNIAENINKLPSLMVQFSDGDSSVSQMLGSMMQNFMMPSMEFERFIVHGNGKIASPKANFFIQAYENVARLVLSFTNNPYSASKRNSDEINVWVNSPRQYIEMMQSLIDQKYDGEMKITLSQMPDENKLVLANASNEAPDIALGVNHWIPYEFASRDAALDLRQFSGYAELVTHFSKGAMIPYVFEEGVYGIPETQNFWVTYYRKDILESIGVTQVPQTWDEIIALLPLLQSYGMNYFMPLSQYSGLKPFVATLPFIYQFGGDLYTSNGMQTAINSEETLKGITLMSDLFTLYNIPKYVASFFNNFRYGTLPIGISDLSTYLLLQSAAPELDGLWGMDLHPGQPDADSGDIIRYAPSGAQASMILKGTKYPEQSWDFLKWWMSTDIQSEFAFLLQSTYGKAYFWNSANLDAFATMSMPAEYKNKVLAQWEYALEAPRIPGAYMVEREISNAWTNIVFNGTNPRQAIDEAVRVANREIMYKMAEFGYTKNGVILKDYPVPSIYTIDRWLSEV